MKLLCSAANEGCYTAVKMLLEAGVGDKDETTPGGLTPLCIAAAHGYKGCLQLLLEAGADKDKADNNGKTPLHIAAWKGNDMCVMLLLDAGANIDKEDEQGMTPLLNATMNYHIECMKLLLDYGADPEIEDKLLWNPLNYVTNALYDDENNVKYNEALKLLLPKVLSIIAKRTLIVAYAKNMIFDTAFIVFKKCVEYDMSFDYEEYDVNNPDTNTELYNIFNEEMIKYKEIV
jgi:ankyrin repeat protein